MTKFLRYVDFQGVYRDAETPSKDDFRYLPAWHRNAVTGLEMYLRHALPIPCQGVAKLNVYGHLLQTSYCTEPVLTIASVYVSVPVSAPENLRELRPQQIFLLETVHRGIELASQAFQFDIQPFRDARIRVDSDNYECAFTIGKPARSPNRRLIATVHYRFDEHPQTTLEIRDKKGELVQSTLFGRATEQSLGTIKWISDELVRVETKDGKEYWDCCLDGSFCFVYPRSSTGDPHHVYRHATILLDGIDVIPDKSVGLALLERAAELGYPHARRRWAKEIEKGINRVRAVIADRPPHTS